MSDKTVHGEMSECVWARVWGCGRDRTERTYFPIAVGTWSATFFRFMAASGPLALLSNHLGEQRAQARVWAVTPTFVDGLLGHDGDGNARAALFREVII